MEIRNAPKRDPALSLGWTRFEIVLVDDGENNLTLQTPPLGSILEIIDLEKSLFSMKQDISSRPLFKDALQEHLNELMSKEARFGSSSTFLNRLANTHKALGEFEKAETILDRAVSIDASSEFIKSKRADVKLLQGNFPVALKEFEELAARGDSSSALKLAWFDVYSGDIGSAVERVERATRINPEGYSERLFQGALYLLQGDYGSAIAAFRLALREQPSSSHLHSNIGMAYIGVGRFDKAMTSLRKAVALDPFNKSALVSLCDVARVLKRDEEVIEHLKYFVEFEQRESDVWGRVAQALLNIGNVDECISALRRQISLSPSLGVWNNLGVAYAIKGNSEASIKAFQQAVSIEDGQDQKGALLVGRNVVQLLSTKGQSDMVLRVAEDMLARDVDGTLLRDQKLGDIYLFYADALVKAKREDEAVALMYRLIGDARSSDELIVSAVSSLIGHFGLRRRFEELLALIESHAGYLHTTDGRLKVRLANNLAFGLAEMGRLDEASLVVSSVSESVRKDAYLTATLGLINIKRGRVFRGESLYREAIHIAGSKSDKARIRQKMHIELARSLGGMFGNKKRRLLEKAASEVHGEPLLTKEARELLTKP